MSGVMNYVPSKLLKCVFIKKKKKKKTEDDTRNMLKHIGLGLAEGLA